MLNGVQSGFNARLIYWGFSAYRVAFGPNPVDLFVRRDDGVDIGASRQQWKLRMAAQGASLRKTANTELRRLRPRNESFCRPGVSAGDSVLFNTLMAERSTPRGCGAHLLCWTLAEGRHSETRAADLPGGEVLLP